MMPSFDYLAAMHAEADIKRLHWRAHHRGTKEADLMIGGFFDAHHASWSAEERAAFARLLEEQDVDVMAWALGTAEPPEHLGAGMIRQLRKLDYIRVAK